MCMIALCRRRTSLAQRPLLNQSGTKPLPLSRRVEALVLFSLGVGDGLYGEDWAESVDLLRHEVCSEVMLVFVGRVVEP